MSALVAAEPPGRILATPEAATITPRDTSPGDPVVAAAGNIACDPSDSNYDGGSGTPEYCQQRATSDLLVGAGLSAVFALGDNQYEKGTLTAYQQVYDPTWGRVKGLTHPAVGNHDYLTGGASGYFGYFGAAAGDPARGYYAYDLGAWHIVVLNSECAQVGGCGAGSPQEQWLRADLAAHPALCTLAYWHAPRFSAGFNGSNPAYDAFWRDLYAAGATIVLNGHDHDYQRFAPQTPDGAPDPARGIREFVVGTGGKSHDRFVTTLANTEVRNNKTFGVLELTLHPGSYDWRFVPIAGQAFADSGSGVCHGATPPATATGTAMPPTSTPAPPTATPAPPAPTVAPPAPTVAPTAPAATPTPTTGAVAPSTPGAPAATPAVSPTPAIGTVPPPAPTVAPRPTATPRPTAPSPTRGPRVLFHDTFGDGSSSARGLTHTGGDGTALVQRAPAHGTRDALRLSESSTTGSLAFVREGLSGGVTNLDVSVDAALTAEGPGSGRVPLMTLSGPDGAPLIVLDRANLDGALRVWLDGTPHRLSVHLPLGQWAYLDLRIVLQGRDARAVEVRVNGALVYRLRTARHAAAASALQIGTTTQSQPFTLFVDNLTART